MPAEIAIEGLSVGHYSDQRGPHRVHRRAGAEGRDGLGGHPRGRAGHAGDGAALAVRFGGRAARGAADRGQRSRPGGGRRRVDLSARGRATAIGPPTPAYLWCRRP